MAIKILEQVPLAPFTTMRVGGNAGFFVRIKNIDELKEAVAFATENNLPIFVLGGGSNTIVSDDGFVGLVIKIEIKGIIYAGTVVTAGAGEGWDNFVRDVVAHNLWGVENLSLVPGTVGGAAVQNIGAYGVEACDTIFSVEAFDIKKMQLKTFLRNECEFGYRESVFKKNKELIVINISFKLNNEGVPQIEYEDIKKYLIEKAIEKPNLLEIREAIVSIRVAKMPTPPLGTAGSFFKNPVISEGQYETLKKQFPDIKAYLQGDGSMKLAAAWLLDKVGAWRGVRRGDAGVHEKQALILVNYGTATANEILSLASDMKKDIKEKINVDIKEEVVVVGK